MRYLTAIIPLFLFFLIDALLIVSIIGAILLVDYGPYSYKFALKIWT